MSSQVSQLLQQSERKNRNTIFELLLKSEITSPLMVFLLCRKSHLQNSGCFPTEMVMTGSWITVLGLRLVADKTSVKNWWFVFCPKRFSVWLMAWDHYQPPSVSLHKPNVQTQNYAKTQIHKFTNTQTHKQIQQHIIVCENIAVSSMGAPKKKGVFYIVQIVLKIVFSCSWYFFLAHDSRTEVEVCVTSPAIYLVLSHKKTENFVNKRRKSFGTQPSKRN